MGRTYELDEVLLEAALLVALFLHYKGRLRVQQAYYPTALGARLTLLRSFHTFLQYSEGHADQTTVWTFLAG
jgi:hypothetical protein